MGAEAILFVDDEAEVRTVVRLFLTHAGYRVTTAANGTEALAACETTSFALVITDLRMPGMSGEELLQQIKQRSPTTDVVIVTGYPTVESAIATLKAGAADYVIKPFKLAALECVVQRCLERRRLQREVSVERRLRAELHRFSTALRHAQENERRRIARELHDGVVQTLSGILLHLDLLGAALENPPLAQELLQEVKGLFTQVFTDVRGLVWSLRPAALDDLGLTDALRGLVAHLSKGIPLKIGLHLAEDLPPLSPAVETALYRIVQEALSNVVRHAQAAQVTVRMETAGGSVQLIVADNGRGFAPAPAQDTAEGATLDKGGIGLWSMRERAEEVGGTLVLRSIPSEGTTILVTVPVLGSTSREQRQSHILNQEGDGVW